MPDTETHDQHSIEEAPIEAAGIEEIVVKSPLRCGSWPVDHVGVVDCEFAELTKATRLHLPDLRKRYFATCLICADEHCHPRKWEDPHPLQGEVCEKLFWTPTLIARLTTSDRSDGSVNVAYHFEISPAGRVQNIEIDSHRGVLEQESVLMLLKRGAARTRFEPLVIEGAYYTITGIQDRLILQMELSDLQSW